jgi:hypothetical protein
MKLATFSLCSSQCGILFYLPLLSLIFLWFAIVYIRLDFLPQLSLHLYHLPLGTVFFRTEATWKTKHPLPNLSPIWYGLHFCRCCLVAPLHLQESKREVGRPRGRLTINVGGGESCASASTRRARWRIQHNHVISVLPWNRTKHGILVFGCGSCLSEEK